MLHDISNYFFLVFLSQAYLDRVWELIEKTKFIACGRLGRLYDGDSDFLVLMLKDKQYIASMFVTDQLFAEKTDSGQQFLASFITMYHSKILFF